MWNTEEDVLNDLATYTGLRSNFDILRGNKPPPPAPVLDEFDNDEYNLRFGGLGSRRPSFPDDKEPDLPGITRLLRMVKNTRDDVPETKQLSPRKGKTESPKRTVVLISKLDPAVPEFVPKSLAGDSTEKAATHKPVEKDEPGEQVHLDVEVAQNEDVSIKQTKTSPLSEEDELVAQLKNKISNGGKATTLQQKRERNVAIAALMRLKTGPPTPSKSSLNSSSKDASSTTSKQTGSPNVSGSPKAVESPLRLEPPEYYAGPCSSPKVVNVEDSEHSIPEPKPLLEPVLRNLSPDEMSNPHIKESIKKVMNWQDKAKTKPSAPHTGLILFRKKKPVSSKSPNSEASKSTTSKSKSSEEELPPPPEDYVPSAFAAELKKQFEERIKAKEQQNKKIEPPETLKKLEDVGITFTFKRRAPDDNHEM